MLKILHRRSNGYIFRCEAKTRSYLPTCALLSTSLSRELIDTTVSNFTVIDKSRLNINQNEIEDLAKILHRLDGALFLSSVANADAVLADFRTIAENYSFQIPLGYYMDAAQMLALRHDAMRLEILLRIAASNLDFPDLDPGTRSRPTIETGWNILVSHSVALLLRYSSGDVSSKPVQPSLVNYKDSEHLKKLLEAPSTVQHRRGTAAGQELLQRMSKSSQGGGAITTRENLTQLLEKLIIAAPDPRPSGFPTLSDLKGLHRSLQGQLWTQSAKHNVITLRLLRQYIHMQLLPKANQLMTMAQLDLKIDVKKEVQSLFASLKAALQQVDELYFSAQGQFGVEAPSIRLQCIVSAVQCLRSLLDIEIQVDLTRIFNNEDLASTLSESMDNNNKNRSPLLVDQIEEGIAAAAATYHDLLRKVEAHVDLSHPSTFVMDRVGSEIHRILMEEQADNSPTINPSIPVHLDLESNAPWLVNKMEQNYNDLENDEGVVKSGESVCPNSKLLAPRAQLREAVTNLTTLLMSVGRVQAAGQVIESYVVSSRGLKIKKIPRSYAAALTGDSFQGGSSPSTTSSNTSNSLRDLRISSGNSSVNDILEKLRGKNPSALERLKQATSRVGRSLWGQGTEALTAPTTTATTNATTSSSSTAQGRWVFERGEEDEWLQALTQELIQHYSPVTTVLCDSLYHSRAPLDSPALLNAAIKLHKEASETITRLGTKIGLSTFWDTAAFNAARIRGWNVICNQLNQVKVPAKEVGAEVTLTVPWRKSLEYVFEIVDNAADEHGRDSSLVCDAIVALLCSFKEEEPLRKAISITQEETTNGTPNLSLASHCLISDTAALCLPDEDLTELLSNAENAMQLLQKGKMKLKGGSSKYYLIQLSQKDAEKELHLHVMLARSKIITFCRLGYNYQAIQELNKLRKLGGYCELDLYNQIIKGLFHAQPVTQSQVDMVTNPSPVVDFLLQEMARDGHVLDDEMAGQLVSLLRRACLYMKRLAKKTSEDKVDDAVQNVENFVRNICIWPNNKNDEENNNNVGECYMGHRRLDIRLSESVCFELLTVYCSVGMEEKAYKFLTETMRDMRIQATAKFYEPLLFYYAIISAGNHSRSYIEELYESMVANDVAQSDLTVSSIILCYLKNDPAEGKSTANDRVREAIDKLDELYHRHKVRPKLNSLILVLDFALQLRDVEQARRLADITKGMYTPIERATLAAHDFDCYRTTDEDDDLRKLKWPPGAPVPSVGHLLHRSTVPGFPKMDAALSDHSLEQRFQRYGLSLYSNP